MTNLHTIACSALLIVSLIGAPTASASPRMPPTLEELVVTCDLIVVAKVLEAPRRVGDLYRVEPVVVLKGSAPGVIRVRSQRTYADFRMTGAERPAAYERGAKRLLLFLHSQPDDEGYTTDIFRRMPADTLSFGFDRKARESKHVLAAARALIALNDPALKTEEAVRLWLEGLRSKNDALVASLVERAGRSVAWGEPRERIDRQRTAATRELVGELRRLVGHHDDEVRADAALYLKGLIDTLASAKAAEAERARAIDALRKHLDDPSVTVRARTLSALAEMGDAAVRPRIIRLLEDPSASKAERESALWSVDYLTRQKPAEKGDDLVGALLATLDEEGLAGYAVAVLQRQTGDMERKTVASWLAYRADRKAGR